ncbi:hypothetical protein [Pyrococcus yayanosii]|uniref:Uncharacterized protein n=1 Tax=Pyrococcus yayanosii (strain CH1 / JCM 16557) TaxID=529709 RepID=F8AHG9_PYRYC|nr:hypothetical protein [Pyrococcus yayanosii]AEH24168.1 hypothetical protein PYCH_04780 [Pyrococcus yayanosii CH1]
MVVRLVYPEALVVIEDGFVRMFKGKLVEAPLEEVLSYAMGEEAIIPEELKEVARDVLVAIEAMNIGRKRFMTVPNWKKVAA